MSFTVRIGADLVPVEPGATVPVTFEIANRSDEQDRYEVSVEGVDPEWVAVPVPMFTVEARDIHQEKVFFKPPRLSESRADDYPYVITVRSLVTGEARTVQGVVGVRPYHHLSMEISPKKGSVSALRKHNSFEVTLMNLGNTEHRVQLFGSDPEDVLAYDFEEEQTDLGPGQTKVVAVTANPARSRPFSSARLHGFQITGRSTNTPSVVCHASAQLEERPVLSPGMLLLAFMGVLLFVGWWLLLPKPPTMDSLNPSNDAPMSGEPVVIRWKASNAKGVRIKFNSETLVDGAELEGEKTFYPTASGTIEAVSYRDSAVSPALTRSITVHEPPETPTPQILSFDIQPRSLKVGDRFLVKYSVSDSVSDLTLSPAGIKLDPKLTQTQVTADMPGEINYELVARNGDKTASKSLKVKVEVGSKASIVVFKTDVTKVPLEGGSIKLTWQVANAARIELVQGNLPAVTLDPQGEREFGITEATDFVLTAIDDQGNQVTKRIKITMEAPPPADGGIRTDGG